MLTEQYGKYEIRFIEHAEEWVAYLGDNEVIAVAEKLSVLKKKLDNHDKKVQLNNSIKKWRTEGI